ncbi:MAG: carbamoyl-phosphate synthase large subunit [Desulfovibrio sp.]|jgi:carbamoyl-phosphate synthase large subunit|nr:carbamoyl-phosphate synthase large subunit [Desulfovibrio sp.]
MPKRTDLHSILVIGAGPIVIGQGCEFDYSGSQAIKALKEEGYRVVLVNSNPATIMTDPQMADATYVEPIEQATLEAVIAKERPDALLPTLGGQTALNAALGLARSGVLAKWGVEMIGARAEVIEKAESRELFHRAMENIGLKVPASGIARCMEDVTRLAGTLPFPVIVRPAFTLGGAGGGIARTPGELPKLAARGLAASPTSEIIIEQSVLGWKEFEMEVMRDRADNCVIVCSIENLDPMGVHTGDSITVAPAQTLTDVEYQAMRDASLQIMREIGVETGGSNVQFGVNPKDGELVVIEMNPRVSRSSALASKATGFPIAKIAAKLAVGYTLDELRNDITRETAASFEPAIDYCVVKVPRFTFEKFPGAEDVLTTSMKSVGEAMSIGRTFKEALQKGLRSMEIGAPGLGRDFRRDPPSRKALLAQLEKPNSTRVFAIRDALLAGMTVEEIHGATAIDPWFLRQMQDIVAMEREILDFGMANDMTPDNAELVEVLRKAKEWGFSDRQLGLMWKRPSCDILRLRKELGILPTYYLVDTCAGEFEAYTPYFYSTYEGGDELDVAPRRKVLILGGGPNRIGQGIEFDYCCCHASFALRDAGVMAIMVNSNPETVSTDYDTSDRLYFEPLTFEDVMNIVEKERPEGVIVQFGGQTPLNLAVPLMRAGVPILGTSPDAIDRAEDRERFQALIGKLGLLQPPNGTAADLAEALVVADRISYPVVVRPSYVLGGRAMAIVYDAQELSEYFREQVPEKPEHPILVDKFLEHAIEVDVDALADGKDVYVAGIMEHIEEAGIHSGDSACVLPSFSISYDHVASIAAQAEALATELKVRGLMNIQFAIKGEDIYILEVNPRASRTAPFVSKATGVPLPYLATQVMLGKTLEELDPWSMRRGGFTCVKEAVLPFHRFPGVDVLLGPEMHSTGEVMGMAEDFAHAFLKSQIAAGQVLPQSGKVFLSVNDRDKPWVAEVGGMFAHLGFRLLATRGTAQVLRDAGLEVETVAKVQEGTPNIVNMLEDSEVALVVNTAAGRHTAKDSRAIRRTALLYGVPYCTTIAGAKASATAIGAMRRDVRVLSLQEYYALESGAA